MFSCCSSRPAGPGEARQAAAAAAPGGEQEGTPPPGHDTGAPPAPGGEQEGTPPPGHDTGAPPAVVAKNRRMLAYMKHRSGDDDQQVDPMLMSTELSRVSSPQMADSADSTASEASSTGSTTGMDPVKRQARMAAKVQKVIRTAEDTAEQKTYLQRYDAPPSVAEEVNSYIGEAQALERSVTKQLKALVGARGGKLKGLDARLKTRSSMTRKILEKLGPDVDVRSVDVRSVVRKQSDALRYTAVFTTSAYVEGVLATIDGLKRAGFVEVKIKNYWRKPGEATDYAGINSVLMVPGSAVPFELQFHTPESLDTKMQRCHHSYSKFREDRSMVRAQYWEEMVRMWSVVPIPDGVSEIGELAVHKVNLNDALRSLSEEERLEIDKVHALEVVVKPLCEQAVANTIEAEKKVTPILSTIAEERGLELHGMDFRIKSALSMARKVVSKLRAENVAETDAEAIGASVWCEQRQALRYTIVCRADSYTDDVLAVLGKLQEPELGFEREFVYNYWLDSEPYNAVRARLWSTDLESWCFLVFHTQESLDMSEARLAYHQRAMGIVFHTASFDEAKVADAVQRLRQDVSWIAKVTRMEIPRDVHRVERVIMQPTTMQTITEAEEDGGDEGEDETETDGITMPSSEKGCWHHKVCYKPVETDEDGVAELPADIRQAVREAKRAEESGKVERAHQLYADAVSALMKLVAGQMKMPSEQRRVDCVEKMTDTFSLANPRLEDCPLTYISPGFLTLTGYAPAEVLGKNCRFLQGPETEAEEVAKMREAVDTLSDCVVTVTNYKKDGTKFINQSSLFTVFETDSECPSERMATVQLLCVHADVTSLNEQLRQQLQADALALKQVVQRSLHKGSFSNDDDDQVGISDTGVTLLATYQKKLRVLATQKEKRKLPRGLASGSTLLKTIDHGSVDSVADANRMALMVL